MNRHTKSRAAVRLTRREALRRIAIVSAGLSAGLAVGCTPLRIGLRMYPGKYDSDSRFGDQVLRAFVSTVIPGAPENAPNLIKVYKDDFYPLTPYRGYLVFDLCDRSDRLFGARLFSDLEAELRTRVIQHALDADKTTRRLYEGGIFLAHISFYAGVYDDAAGCELIEFDGASRLLPLAEQTYPDPEGHFAACLTQDGNYA